MSANEVVGPIVTLCGVVVLLAGVLWGIGDVQLIGVVSHMAFLICVAGVLLLGLGVSSWSDIL